jgi:hypothetical protein
LNTVENRKTEVERERDGVAKGISIVALLTVDLADIRTKNTELKKEGGRLRERVAILTTGKLTFTLLMKNWTRRITTKRSWRYKSGA